MRWFAVPLCSFVLLAACTSGQDQPEAAATEPAAAGTATATSGATVEPDPTATPEPARQVSRSLSDASPPDLVPEFPGGASGFSRYVFERLGDVVVTTLVEGPAGPQVRDSISYLQLKELVESGGYIPESTQLSDAAAAELIAQLDIAREATAKYEDINVALADGYVQTTVHVPNMGAHFLNADLAGDGIFDPAKPEILIYETDGTGWKLIALSYVIPTQLAGERHPEAFAGDLDNWHVHFSLCLGSAAITRSMVEDDCLAAGGSFLPQYGWMIHAWVHKDNPLGIFAMWNPLVEPVMTAQDVEDTRTEIDPGSNLVSIQNFAHGVIEVSVGEDIVWVNADPVPHTVTSGNGGVGDGGFDSGLLGPGQSYTLRFDTPGEYQFTCAIHPSMNGTVIVTGS